MAGQLQPSSKASGAEVVTREDQGKLLPFGEGRCKAIAEIQLGRVTLAFAKALKQPSGASCQGPIHRHHIGIQHKQQGLSRLQYPPAMGNYQKFLKRTGGDVKQRRLLQRLP
jgi:hypothetical protein